MRRTCPLLRNQWPGWIFAGVLLLAVPTLARAQGLQVNATATAPTPTPVCPNGIVTSDLSAVVANPPSPTYGCPIWGPIWSWTVSQVQYSADNVHWGPSPGGDSEGIDQPDDTSSQATLTASFPQTGYWQVTAQATATCTNQPCTSSWTGTGTVTFTVQVINGQSTPITVTVSAGPPTPNPICLAANGQVTSTLSASVSNPPSNSNLTGVSWTWSVTGVQYSTDNKTWQASPGGDSESIEQPEGEYASAYLVGSFPQAGYWQVTVQATATYSDGQCDTWTGTGTTTVTAQVSSGHNTPVTVTATAGSPSPSPVCLNSEVDTSLSATVANPPNGGGITGPVWSWAVTNVQFSTDNKTWQVSPGGDSESIQENASAGSATLSAWLPTAGYWQITAAATVTYTDSQCNTWTGTGTVTTASIQVGGGGQNTPVTVQVSAGSVTPNPVCIGSTSTCALTASVSNPPASGSYSDGPNWSWSVTNVQYSSDGKNWVTPPQDGDSESVEQSDSNPSQATLSASFPQAGYWQVTVEADVEYDDSPCSDTWTGSGTVNVVFQVSGGGQTNNLMVSASSGPPTPAPVCISNPATASLSATVFSPPSGGNISAPAWSWTITKVQYSTNGQSWGPSPGGDSESITQPNGSSAAATLTATFPQAGYWQITAQATVSYNDSPCSDTWTGSGTTTVTLVSTAGQNHPVTVNVSATGPTPNVVCGNCTPSASLSATVSNPPTGTNGPNWSWSIKSVQFRPTQSDAWEVMDSSDYSMALTSQGGGSASWSGSFYQGGYYQVTVQAAVEYNDSLCSNTWTGSATVTMQLTVVDVAITPYSSTDAQDEDIEEGAGTVNVAVGCGPTSVLVAVYPPEMASRVTISSADTTIATVSGNLPFLAVTGVAEGSTTLGATVGSCSCVSVPVIVSPSQCLE